MMNFWKANIYKILLIFLLLAACVVGLDTYLEKKMQQEEEEIERIDEYFQEVFEVYKIPLWVEIAPILKNPLKLQDTRYLLLIKEELPPYEEAGEIPLKIGIPYYPFSTPKEAKKVYNKIPDEDKEGYIIVSSSIIYYGKCKDEHKLLIEEAADYFNKENADN